MVAITLPRKVSFKTTFVSATLPQLVTTPLNVSVSPTDKVGGLQILVTAIQGVSVTRHGAVA